MPILIDEVQEGVDDDWVLEEMEEDEINNVAFNQNNNSKSPRQVRSTSIENSNNTVEYNIVDDDMIDVESPNIIENNEIEENTNVKQDYSNNFNIPLIKTISSMLNMNSFTNKDSNYQSPKRNNSNEKNNYIDEDLIKKMNDLESNINNIENENKDSIFTSNESFNMNSTFKNIRLEKDMENYNKMNNILKILQIKENIHSI
jgi:hypothetical protein